jgi:hypothetical protein
MKMKICFMALVLGLVASTATYGANVHFNIGGVDANNAAYDSDNTPAHADGANVAVGETYNQVITGTGPFPLKFGDGTMDTGLTLHFQTSAGSNTDSLPNWYTIGSFNTSATNPMGIQNGPGGTNGVAWQSEVGMFLSGLPAGAYDIYVACPPRGDSEADPAAWAYGEEPGLRGVYAGTNYVANQFIYANADDSAVITNSGIDAWVEGDTYAKLRVVVNAGDTLCVGTDTYPVGRDRGMIALVEIVGVPEPATMALLGLGSLVMLRRRK